MVKLSFLPNHEEIEVPSGSELLSIHKKYPQLPLVFGCTRGQCGVCAVLIVHGEEHVSQKSPQEEETLLKKKLGAHCRLACQCALNGDLTLIVLKKERID